MRAGIVVSVTPQDRIRLEAIVADRNTRQKHAARAQVIIATAAGCGTTEIMCRFRGAACHPARAALEPAAGPLPPRQSDPDGDMKGSLVDSVRQQPVSWRQP